jgi:hypothetical protein
MGCAEPTSLSLAVMAKSSTKYTLLPDADEGNTLLEASDTPGDDSNEADAEGENAGSAAG